MTQNTTQSTDSTPGSDSGAHTTEDTLSLEHSYTLTSRVHNRVLFSIYNAIQRPFGRLTQIRFYSRIDDIGLSHAASDRIRGVLAGGCGDDRVVDHGELPDGSPFIIVKPPHGQPAREWFNKSEQKPSDLAELGRLINLSVKELKPQKSLEATLEKVFVSEGPADVISLELMCLGDSPTRVEVREMTRVVPRDFVLGFPPECFIPPTSESEAPEDTEKARVYRSAAILYELATGQHPFFPIDADVAESVAALVTDVGRRPSPVKIGSKRLETLILDAVSIDPEQRPSWAEWTKAIAEHAQPVPPTRGQPSLEIDAIIDGPSRFRALLTTGLKVLTMIVLVVGVAVATFLWSSRLPSETDILITSDPTGVTFERIDDRGQTVLLGATPLLLADEPIDSTLEIRRVYSDGTRGQTQLISPEQLQIIDSCRAVHVQFSTPAP